MKRGIEVPRFIIGIVVLIVAALPFGAAAGADSTCSDPPPVLVPVTLDDVRYQPAEFNRVNRELHCNGIVTHSVVDPDGSLQVFTTTEGYNEYAIKVGLGVMPSSEQMQQMVSQQAIKVITGEGRDILILRDGQYSPGPQDKEIASGPSPLAVCGPPIWTITRNWDLVNCGGSVFSLGANSGVANLGLYGWNNAISSVQVPANIVYERLWDYTGFSGPTLTLRPVYGATNYPDLGFFGWSNRASSIYNCQTGC